MNYKRFDKVKSTGGLIYLDFSYGRHILWFSTV